MNEKRTESTSIVSQNNVNNRGKGKSLGSLYDGFDTERTLWLLLKNVRIYSENEKTDTRYQLKGLAEST